MKSGVLLAFSLHSIFSSLFNSFTNLLSSSEGSIGSSGVMSILNLLEKVFNKSDPVRVNVWRAITASHKSYKIFRLPCLNPPLLGVADAVKAYLPALFFPVAFHGFNSVRKFFRIFRLADGVNNGLIGWQFFISGARRNHQEDDGAQN